MNNHNLLFLSGLLMAFLWATAPELQAQQAVPLQATKQLLSNGGGQRSFTDINNRDYLVQYSIGELVVHTGIVAGVAVSFGFNQANDRIEVTSLKDAVIPGLKVFPNPVLGGRLSIRSEEALQLESLGLYTAGGQQVMQVYSPLPQEEWNLNVSSLASGVYVLKLRTQQGRMGAYRVRIP